MMQTPKVRANSSDSNQRRSPRALSSSEACPNPSVSRNDSPSVVRKLKTSPRYLEPTASSANQARRASSEIRQVSDQIAELESELCVVKDRLRTSVLCKNRALQDAEESNRQLPALSVKLLEIEQRIAEKSCILVQDRTLRSEPEVVRSRNSRDAALDEIERLEIHLGIAGDTELRKLKATVEEMKHVLTDRKESEDRAKELIGKTLMQLEMARKTVSTLRTEGNKATEAYGAVLFELEKSRDRVNFLEGLVGDLKAEIECKDALESVETEVDSLRREVEELRSVLEASKRKFDEERSRHAEEMRNAVEIAERIRSASGQREAELEAELRKSKYEIEELKTKLIEKETELDGICDENDDLVQRLENATSGCQEHELEKLKLEIDSKKSILLAKETELSKSCDENRYLKLRIKEIGETSASDLAAAKAAEREAVMKVGYLTEEVEKCDRKLARVTEQLEAEQGASAELEGELRRLKVQSDQWRKAAEAATAMLAAGNSRNLIERTGSMDSSYCRRTMRINAAAPYVVVDDIDEEMLKKKNGRVLGRFGVLWKKPQKYL
ncbi:interactor of constitutive active ROPs 3-like [Andrographis paniculata]|uniref:interactor of constitutive active ROPs 3-like n=1 Tax=Andrographis paniculata TaxID=175694 RepID=UPI0021E92E04|nr:interactor of constitutive active ROPs 3-like [Andrographis paniculata]XP_051134147.1 interactor of constitutive active ROPs 3-like [Andrographis paniculata]XP_051134148.1 interactor of constitutive active ROPs 3-like [Andrographis paniculata]XP_051134149.1 interactor of constitutive active ROPs 3-like [Andrographis paniculata]XP_051134150.1 interactor of constitutive active ROPs 3-like [Andrographis paniculata]